MNRFLLLLIAVLLPYLLWAAPDASQLSLAEGFIRGYYEDQNITDEDGSLITGVVIEQEIRSISDGKESVVKAHMYMKDEKTYLVYLKNDRNESICYLYRGDKQWVYRESLHNPMRINMSQNVSGMANLGDLIGIDIIRDFDLSEVIETSDTYELIYQRARSSFPYPSIIIGVERSSEDISFIEYQGLGGRSMRRVNLVDYGMVSGQHRIPVWQIRNLVTDTRDSTEIEYLAIREAEVPGAYFSPSGNSLSHFLKWADRAIR